MTFRDDLALRSRRGRYLLALLLAGILLWVLWLMDVIL